MLILANDQLQIELIDPVSERTLLGPRFCWGGFIWQVHDHSAGPLLRGPEWPERRPNPWNAQGLPESFRHRTRTGAPLTWNGNRGVAIGAGELALDASGEPVVVAPCEWEIAPSATSVDFHTRQQAAGFYYDLTRRIELCGRTVDSVSKLTNQGGNNLRLEWFAHPFFVPVEDLVLADLPEGTTLSENPGFELCGRTLRQKRKFTKDTGGHMDFLGMPANMYFSARLKHPLIGWVQIKSTIVPTECVIWGNSNTFSIEPYASIDLAPGQAMTWHIRYLFGESSGQTSP